mmetsp:Transcript_1686/g.3144  ORF Transcript_1686/g.3144 Transcript_1686/m.3144 type:complete len:198 (-) Transcript_1686:1174-1767(-)
MAQGDSEAILKAFHSLEEDDRRVLSDEMAMTGNQHQQFERDGFRETRGPAILVYYSPALMQKSGKKDPVGALKVLAEVFRQARTLWPLTMDPEDVDRSVTVRIDMLKELEVPGILQPGEGQGFVLCKNSSVDSQVKLLPISTFPRLDKGREQILSFNGRRNTGGGMALCMPRLPWSPQQSMRARWSFKSPARICHVE